MIKTLPPPARWARRRSARTPVRSRRPRRGVPSEVGEVLRLPPEGALHAVRQVGVAPVEHLAEQVGEQVDELARYALLGGSAANSEIEIGA